MFAVHVYIVGKKQGKVTQHPMGKIENQAIRHTTLANYNSRMQMKKLEEKGSSIKISLMSTLDMKLTYDHIIILIYFILLYYEYFLLYFFPGACSEHASGAVCNPNMALEYLT